MKVWMFMIGLSMMVSFLCISQSPVMTVIIILFLTIYNSIWLYIQSVFSFYSYIIFLIFMGGLLVLFAYMCSLASNEKSFYNLISFSSMTLILMILGTNYYFIMKEEKFLENSINIFHSFFKFFFFNVEMIYFYIFIYLLLTLFVTVILSKKKEGAIRMKSI